MVWKAFHLSDDQWQGGNIPNNMPRGLRYRNTSHFSLLKVTGKGRWLILYFCFKTFWRSRTSRWVIFEGVMELISGVWLNYHALDLGFPPRQLSKNPGMARPRGETLKRIRSTIATSCLPASNYAPPLPFGHLFFFFLRGCRQWLQSSPKCIHYKTIITSMSKFNSSAVDFETPNFIFHLFGDDYICWYGWLVVLFEVYRHSFLIDFSRICWP